MFPQKECVLRASDFAEIKIMKKKIVIIGAGPAGLTGARYLLKNSNDYEVVILEASAEIGGISRTVRHNGNRMDIGGHRFFTKDAEVAAFWNEVLPLQGAPALDDKLLSRTVPLAPNGPDPEREDKVMLNRHRVSRIYYLKKFFDYPVRMNFSTVRNLGVIATFLAGMSYLFSIVKKLPETSLENFYINRFGRRLYSMFFEGYTEKLWGRHPREISANWGAQRVKGLSISAVLKDILSKAIPRVGKKNRKVETSLIEEFIYPKFGPGQLWETVAEEIEKLGGRIVKNCEVKKIVRGNAGNVEKVLCERDGNAEEFDGDIFISSMPLKDLVSGMNGVPVEVAKVATGLPYRDFVTVGLLFDKLNLKNETRLKTLSGIVPDCWIYVQDTSVKLGRIQVFNNWSPYMVADPEKRIWIGLEYFCNEGDEFWEMSEDAWREKGFAELVAMEVVEPTQKTLDFHVEKVKKAYPAYFDTYKNIGELIGFLNTIPNLYCVGRNGQHRYNNMDHSMATAFEAVRNILRDGASDKSAIWNINTEQEYHERKSA